MFDVDENADRNGRRILWMTVCGFGILPDVNGIKPYFMTFFVALIVWFWKKYL
jgi:hypothetical protein